MKSYFTFFVLPHLLSYSTHTSYVFKNDDLRRSEYRQSTRYPPKTIQIIFINEIEEKKKMKDNDIHAFNKNGTFPKTDQAFFEEILRKRHTKLFFYGIFKPFHYFCSSVYVLLWWMNCVYPFKNSLFDLCCSTVLYSSTELTHSPLFVHITIEDMHNAHA